jgi:hypothetical protein
MLRYFWTAIAMLLIEGGNAIANNPATLPKDVPPVLGVAVVSNLKNGGDLSRWDLTLTIPKIKWEVVGEMVPKERWPELKVETEKLFLTLQMGGPSQLEPSRVVDLEGKELRRDQVAKRLEKETPVLISVSGRLPDAYYLQLTNRDALIVILGARDGYPAPELLPSQKATASKTGRNRD